MISTCYKIESPHAGVICWNCIINIPKTVLDNISWNKVKLGWFSLNTLTLTSDLIN
jgi:hypothetical protein